MATAAALMNTPAARLTTGDNRLAQADRDRDDHFTRLLDTERDDRAAKTETGNPAPVPVAEASPKPEDARASSDNTAGQIAADKASAKKAFQAALNNLNAEGDTSSYATAEAGTEVAGAITKPAATAVAQTTPGLLATANATSTTANAATTEATTIDASAIAALLGATQPLAAQAVTPGETKGEGEITIQAAQPGAGGIVPPTPDELPSAAEPGAEIGKGPKPQDAAAPSPASAQAKVQPAAQAAVQTPSPADSTAKTAIDASAPTPPAAAQQASTGNPLSDASRAAATPPALQSAPAATIEVYSRIIERADGRAHRFEVRLDPVELGQVDVRIEIGADKKVHAVLAAHDSASLSDLMRGQRALERALSDAGIDLADNGVRFEMSNDGGRSAGQRDGEADTRSGKVDVWRKFDSVQIPMSAEATAAAVPAWRVQRLDLVA